ncbi:unnamed protein product [Diamesa serratosioi]
MLLLSLTFLISHIIVAGQSIKDLNKEYDLMTSISLPQEGVSFVDGSDGFPAYGIENTADIRVPYSVVLEPKLFEFTISGSIRSKNPHGYLFSIVDPMDKTVQLGIKVASVSQNLLNFTLVYNAPSSVVPKDNSGLVSFQVPYISKHWVHFAIQVMNDKITFYHNCLEVSTVNISKEPKELIFDSASTFYLAQAGSIIKEKFEGTIQFLKLYKYPEFYVTTMCTNKSAGVGENEFTDEYTDGIQPPPFPPSHQDAKNRLKGEKGDRGPKGIPGDSIRGSPGPPGLQGSKGTCDTMPAVISSNSGIFDTVNPSKNLCTCELTDIMEVLKNDSLRDYLRGPPGMSGKDGKNGINGSTGNPGVSGERGFPGVKGDRGDKGDIGPIGPEGIQGSKGEQGIDGFPGVRSGSGASMKGDKGDSGLRGDRGLQGSKGDRGDRGLSGIKGDRGEGSPGIPGVKGEQGLRGRRGKAGLPGKVGSGEIGLPGYPGQPGTVGTKGEPGLKGQKGETIPGMKGEKGEKGIDGRDGRDGKPGPPGLPGYTDSTDGNGFNSNGGRMAPGTITFQNTDAMIKSSLMNPVGTLAYVIDEEAVLVRVNKGWQYIALGTLLPLATQPPTTTTITPSYGPDLQASNLINNIQKPEFSLRMAALNEPYTGNLQGMRIADLNCHRQARRAGLIGTFRALLSARIQNLDSIVRQEDRELPVVNTRGDVLFNSWNSIFNSQGGFFSQAPRIYSFSGKNVLNDPTWPQKAIWHGAKMDSIDTNCENWHSSAPEKVGLGSSLLGNKLLDQEMYSCKQKNIVLCIEVLSPHESSRKRRDLITHNIDDDDADERER